SQLSYSPVAWTGRILGAGYLPVNTIFHRTRKKYEGRTNTYPKGRRSPAFPCSGAEALQQLLPLLGLAIGHAAEQLDGLAQAEARQVGTEDLHGVEHRDRAGLAGDGREDQRHQV